MDSDFSLDSVAVRLEKERGGKRVVLVSGTYDLFHEGHVRCLTEAKKQGDVLVVGINSDERVRSRKGPRRPIIKEHDRAAVVEGLKAVDYVFIKREPFNTGAIKKLNPYVLVFTSDESALASHKEIAAEYSKIFPAMKVVFLERVGKGTSTTKIEAEIVNRARLYE